MIRPVPGDRRYTDAEVHAAVAGLADADRLKEAQAMVARAAPQLERVLSEALAQGGWFSGAHDEQVTRAAWVADPDERVRHVRQLVEEETRLGMLVGVTVGLELARELEQMTKED